MYLVTQSSSTANASRVAQLGLLALLASGALLLSPAEAIAHSGLVGTVPADRSTVPVVPDQVTLRFGASISERFATVVVTGPDGARASEGDPQVASETVTQRLRASGPGAYRVAWRVVSGDGHPVTGAFTFAVTGASVTPTSSPAPGTSSSGTSAPAATSATPPVSTASSPAPAATSSATDDDNGALPLAAAAAVPVAAAAALLLARRRRSGGQG